MPRPVVSEADIRDWCIAYLARSLGGAAEAVGADSSFAEVGLDSVHAAHFIVELEEWLGLELDPDIVYEHPTAAALAHHVAAHYLGNPSDSDAERG